MASGSPRRRGELELRGQEVPFTRRVYMPVLEFIHTEWIGSAILLAAAVTAMVWANSPWAESYHHLWETVLSVDLGAFAVSMDLHHWINDGLMALFFFVVGLEIKRELLHGNLSDPRRAALPAVAAVGGMVVPALLYAALNGEGEAARGWGIPMATDIAFALGVLGLLGRRIPATLRVFLLALAIVDDLGAILVIALFYTEQISPGALGVGAVILGGMLLMQRAGIRTLSAYMLVGVAFWLAILASGIHATLAGVVLGAMTPSRPYFSGAFFLERSRDVLDRFREARDQENQGRQEVLLGELHELLDGTESPLEAAERTIHPWSSYLILPLFALANAGVSLSAESLGAGLRSPVALGIALGLVGGKILGIGLASWAAVRTRLAVLPPGVGWRHLVGASALAGVGFTVSLFIADLAFETPAIVTRAKLGILAGSLLAGALGFVFLRLTCPLPEEEGLSEVGGRAP